MKFLSAYKCLKTKEMFFGHDCCIESLRKFNKPDGTMKRLLGVALAALSIHANSFADVMYQWTAVADATPAKVSMTLVFSDDVVAQGQFSFHLAPMQPAAVAPAGLDYFSFGVKGITPMSYTAGTGLFGYGWGILDMTLQFSPEGYLSGSIYANDTNSDVSMRSTGSVFTIGAIHSDQDMVGGLGCGADPSCTWSSGILARVVPAGAADLGGSEGPVGAEAVQVPVVAQAVQVPEPGSLALTALGLLGLGGVARRKLAGAPEAPRG